MQTSPLCYTLTASVILQISKENKMPNAQSVLLLAQMLDENVREYIAEQEAHKRTLEAIVYTLVERTGGTLELPFNILTKDRDESCSTNGGLHIQVSEDDNLIKVDVLTPAQVDAQRESVNADQH